MDFGSFLRIPEIRGSKVIVKDGNGRFVAQHDRLALAKDYFNMSNDAFYDIYGFNLVPTGVYYDSGKRAAGKM